MKKSLFVFMGILTLVTTLCRQPDPAGAQTVNAFQLERQRESRIAAAAVLLLSAGTLIHLSQDGPVPSRLARSDIFAPDRFAVDLQVRGTGKASDLTAGFCLALPLLTAAAGDEKQYLLEDLVICVESALLTQGVIELSKSVFQRPRPYAYRAAGDARLGRNAGRSFISGHTAAAFQGAVCAAVLFSERHPRSPLRVPVWVAGLSCAAATAVLRVLSGNHFPTDVLAGAAAGSFIGWLIPALHRRGSTAEPLFAGAGTLGIAITF
ncbi:phosphatase PAP2 family protein [bacterium]|nr:phosphatase PAP2 family protein [bacterium]